MACLSRRPLGLLAAHPGLECRRVQQAAKMLQVLLELLSRCLHKGMVVAGSLAHVQRLLHQGYVRRIAAFDQLQTPVCDLVRRVEIVRPQP